MYGKSEYVRNRTPGTETTQLVLGLLHDFGGFLTTREKATTLSSHNDSAPMVELIREFLELRQIDDTVQPNFQWERKCIRSNKLQAETSPEPSFSNSD